MKTNTGWGKEEFRMKNEETKTGAHRATTLPEGEVRRISCHPSRVTCHLARPRVNFFFILHSSFFILHCAARPVSNQKSNFKFQSRAAFTLVELLVVISIIGILAALLMPLGAAVKKNAYISRTKAEMSQVQTAIESYKAAYGFYPPDNPNNPLTNQLYYELIGTTNTVVSGVNTCVTLDSSAQIPSNSVITVFNTGGFINCNGANKSAEDSRMARSFLSNLKPQQVATNPVNGVSGVALLVGSVGGPDLSYQPMGASGLNPWRYNSSNPTNNPGAYDLYIQLVVGGKTNLVCNWKNQVQVNSPLP